MASTYYAEGLPYSIVRQLSSEYFTGDGDEPPERPSATPRSTAWLWNAKLLLERRSSTVLTARGAAGSSPWRRCSVSSSWRWAWPPRAASATSGRCGADARWSAAFLAATHDIAVDGFYLEALDKRGQTELSGLRVAAYRAAMLTGNGLLVMAGAPSAGHGRTLVADLLPGGRVAMMLAMAGVPRADAPPRGPRWWSPLERAPLAPPPEETPGREALLPGRFPVLLPAAADRWARWRSSCSTTRATRTMFGHVGALPQEPGPRHRVCAGRVGTLGTLASISGSMLGSAAIARWGLRRLMTPIALGQSMAILAYVALAVRAPRGVRRGRGGHRVRAASRPGVGGSDLRGVRDVALPRRITRQRRPSPSPRR